jgi:glycerol-3-phosphate acyltransferase PlsY
MIILFLFIFAYLCGSISSAVIVCKIMGLTDPRTVGSGNPGTTNVLRIGGKVVAVVVLVLDAFKGLLPIVVAKIFISNPFLIGFIGLAAIVGHMYPIFFKFKGGKGVATLIGVLLGIAWSVGLVFLVVWIVMAKVFRYSSLAALTATALMPFVAWGLVSSGYFLPLLLTAILVFYRHRANIQRLRDRTETKI